MSLESVRESLRLLDSKGELTVGSAPSSAREWLNGIAIPDSLRRLLLEHWPTTSMVDSPFVYPSYRLSPAETIPDCMDAQLLVGNNMLPIGCSANGDTIVVRFGADVELEVGFVSHDHLWEDQIPPHECYERIAGTMDEFFLRIVNEEPLPLDYREARERRY